MQKRILLNEAVVVAGVPFLLAIAEPETAGFIAALAVTTLVYAFLGWYLQPTEGTHRRFFVLWFVPPALLALAGLATMTEIAFGPVFLYFLLGHLRTTCSSSAGPRPTVGQLLLTVTPALLMLAGLAVLSAFADRVIGHALLWFVSRSKG